MSIRESYASAGLRCRVHKDVIEIGGKRVEYARPSATRGYSFVVASDGKWYEVRTDSLRRIAERE